jgi:tetratricopeptide (TPR) repeat protein
MAIRFTPWFLIFAGLFMLSFSTSAQTEQQKVEALQGEKSASHQRAITLQLDSGVLLLHQGEYQAAEKKFLYVLKNMRSIPTDLAYHFGVTSYYLGKFKQSVDWLTKYIQLKGTNGQYSESASEWLTKAEAELVKQEQALSLKTGQVLSKDYEIDCGPSGRVTCPACGGTTVIVKKGTFEDTYKTCPFCNKVGWLSCADYNKIVRGELKPAED